MLIRVLRPAAFLLCLCSFSATYAVALKEGSYSTPNGMQKYYYGRQGSKFGVTFEPLLARSDTALLMAVNELAPKLIGVQTAKCSPALEDKVIAFHCATGDVFVLISKDEATGKIFAMSFWGKRR